ncbi:unnamed protein product [Symbiodinium natans]|uniref:Uncharacterized protein n=1 Tax=Symbiodinium natans TaxID=878477 RepID=A0A812HAW6_9DINO|nr:unnamed protein product [Symbiodinium natans]
MRAKVEVYEPERCCKRISVEQCVKDSKITAIPGDCTSGEKRLLDNFLTSAIPSNSSNHSKAQCKAQLSQAFGAIQNWTANLSLHGYWIHSLHTLHLSEVISAQLFVSGFPFGTGSIGSRLFRVKQRVKLLWSGISQEERVHWKKMKEAGELSEDTELGALLPRGAEGPFDSCDYLVTVLTFWQTASCSLLSIERDKPVLILVNKSEEDMQKTVFWNVELAALATNPPLSKIQLVSFHMDCLSLVSKLSRRIEDLAGNSRPAELRWSGITEFTCERVGTDGAVTEKQEEYPPPLWRAELLQRHNLTAKVLKGKGFVAGWLLSRGFSIKELKDSGFGVLPLKDAGQTLKDIREAGYSAKSLWDLGHSGEELREAGFMPKELLRAGWGGRHDTDKLEKVSKGTSSEHLKQLKQLMSSPPHPSHRPSLRDLKEAGFSAEVLKEVFPFEELARVFTHRELQEAGFELVLYRAFCGDKGLEVGASAAELKEAGCSAAEVKQATGFSAKRLGQAGFSYRALKRAGLLGKR